MKATRTEIKYNIENELFNRTFVTVAVQGAEAICNMFKAKPELLSIDTTIIDVAQYDAHNNRV